MGETSKECLKDRVVLNFENNTFVTQISTREFESLQNVEEMTQKF